MKVSTPRVPRRRRCVLAALVVSAAALPAWAGGGGLEPPPEPPGNPLTEAKANLGKVLFWDEQVSSTGTVACGTCHIPLVGGGDPRGGLEISRHPGPDQEFQTEDDIFGSPGVVLNHADGDYDWSPFFGLMPQVTRRRTTSAINAGYAPELFWDGR
ncbi:MAG: cytochrome-c peroxidase, partial [Chloroflexi bacterium]|nr:cytochrome-c peroxidase [Chloroflexota bacterium]